MTAASLRRTGSYASEDFEPVECRREALERDGERRFLSVDTLDIDLQHRATTQCRHRFAIEIERHEAPARQTGGEAQRLLRGRCIDLQGRSGVELQPEGKDEIAP